MLWYRKLAVLFFAIQCTFSLFAQCGVGKVIETCLNSASLQTTSTSPGSWSILTGSGLVANSTSTTTSVSGLPEGISKFLWVPNDNTCKDTVFVRIPKLGTTTASVLGVGTLVNPTEVKVSFGSILKFNTLGSVLPKPVANVSSVAYFVYTCQPPSNPDVLQDLCVNKGSFENVNNLKNDGALVAKLPVTGQTYWVVPVLSNGITLQGPQVDPVCQKTGTPIKFTLLNDITYTITNHCKEGKSEIVFSGGDAEFFGSKLTISNVVSKKALFFPNTMSLNHGQKLTITELANGETISFDVTDALGYTKKVSYMFPPCPACITTIGYKSNYCRYDSIASPIFYNNSGIGRLKVMPKTGLVWDTISGKVDVRKSLPGTYSITNITSLSCPTQDTNLCTLRLLDSIKPPVSPSVDTLCMPNPKVGNIKSVVAQLITWYDQFGNKLNPDIAPAVDGMTYYSTQTINGCESIKVPIRVLAPKVSAPTGNSLQFVCKEKLPTIADLKPSGANISWYATAQGGVKLPVSKLLTEATYYATIKLRCESQQRLEVEVKFDTPPIPVLQEDTLRYCYSLLLKIDSLKPYGKQYAWYAKVNDIDSLQAQDKLEQGTYYVSYINTATNCQSLRKKVRVYVTEIQSNLKVFAPNCDNADGVLLANASQGTYPYNYLWSNGNSSAKIENVKPGDYTLKVVDAKGCSLDTLVQVVCRKKVSSILTPDGNNINDVWLVGYAQQFPQVKVLIYNRWGNLVYTSEVPYQDTWDGRSNVGIDQPYVPAGTYFYQIYKTPDSSPESGFIEVLK